jgi:hypothetical protein
MSTPLRLSIATMFLIARLSEGVDEQKTGPCGVVTQTCEARVLLTLKPLAFNRFTSRTTSLLLMRPHTTP